MSLSPESYESEFTDLEIYERFIDYVTVNDLQTNADMQEIAKRLRFLATMGKHI